MVRNPKMSMFRTGSKAHIQAQLFNKVYTKLLKTLELTFNGKPTEIKNALGLMFAVQLHLKNLVRTPIDDVNGIPDMGPNAGPTFIFTPEWNAKRLFVETDWRQIGPGGLGAGSSYVCHAIGLLFSFLSILSIINSPLAVVRTLSFVFW